MKIALKFVGFSSKKFSYVIFIKTKKEQPLSEENKGDIIIKLGKYPRAIFRGGLIILEVLIQLVTYKSSVFREIVILALLCTFSHSTKKNFHEEDHSTESRIFIHLGVNIF